MGQVFEQVHSVEDMALLSEAELVAFLADAFRYCGYVVKDMPDEEDYGASFVMSKIDRKIAVRAAQDADETGLDVVKEAHFAKDFYKTDEAWVVSPHGFTPQAVSAAKDTGVRLVEGEVVLQLLELYAVDTIGPAPDAADTQDEPHASSMSDERLLASASRDAGDIRSVVIPEGVEEIEQGAFAGRINLQSLTLPSTLKRIGIGAFKGCKALEKVVLPSSIEEVMPYAFEGCSDLSEVTILGEGCHGTFYRSSFVGCPKQDIATSLQNFPSTVTLVNDAAFSEMFDGPAHELRALKFDAHSDDRWSTSRSKGFRIVDHGVEGLNSFAGTTVDGQAVQFCIELNHDCTRGYYAIGGAPSASGQRPILEEGYLEPKADRFSSRDPSQKAIGNLVGDFSVYLYHCHLTAGPSIDGTSAAFLEDAYHISVIPLVEEYRRVAADESGRGRKFEEHKLALLDGLHAKIKSVNSAFERDASLVELDVPYYVAHYAGTLGKGLAPSAEAARAREVVKRNRSKARSSFFDGLLSLCLRGCGWLVMLAIYAFCAIVVCMGLLMLLFI